MGGGTVERKCCQGAYLLTIQCMPWTLQARTWLVNSPEKWIIEHGKRPSLGAASWDQVMRALRYFLGWALIAYGRTLQAGTINTKAKPLTACCMRMQARGGRGMCWGSCPLGMVPLLGCNTPTQKTHSHKLLPPTPSYS